jgi:hypothetical protein
MTAVFKNGRFFLKISDGGVHNHSVKRQEISKWSWQVTSPVWGKKNEEHSVERLCNPPLSRFSDSEEKAAILNCGHNTSPFL